MTNGTINKITKSKNKSKHHIQIAPWITDNFRKQFPKNHLGNKSMLLPVGCFTEKTLKKNSGKQVHVSVATAIKEYQYDNRNPK